MTVRLPSSLIGCFGNKTGVFGNSHDVVAMRGLIEGIRDAVGSDPIGPTDEVGLISRELKPGKRDGDDPRCTEIWAVRTIRGVQIEIPEGIVPEASEHEASGTEYLFFVLGTKQNGLKVHIHRDLAAANEGQVLILDLTICVRRWYLCDDAMNPIVKRDGQPTDVHYIWELNGVLSKSAGPTYRLIVRNPAEKDGWYNRPLGLEGSTLPSEAIITGCPDRTGRALEFAYKCPFGSHDNQHWALAPVMDGSFTRHHIGYPEPGKYDDYDESVGHTTTSPVVLPAPPASSGGEAMYH